MSAHRRPSTAVAVVVLVTVALLPAMGRAAGGAPRAAGRQAGAAAGPLPRIAPPDDVPLPGNPASPLLDHIEVRSAELDARRGDLDRAEARRDGAVRARDGLRRRIDEIAAERTETVTLLAHRRDQERARGQARERAVRAHRLRIAEVRRAEGRLGRARDLLRELVLDSYMSGSTRVADEVAVLTGTGELNDSLMRITLGERTVAGRAGDVEGLLAALDRAEADRDEAQAQRRRAQRAEQDAVAARRAAEARIVELDREARRTVEAEAEAALTVADREADVATARDRIAPARLRADVVGLDFQLVALDAWIKASAGAPCLVPWWSLAGISKVEGRHGTYGGGTLTAQGQPTKPIIGPELSGGPFAVIRDTDGGRWDGDATYDRAVGPMQFIPATWRAWARDGDGDGVADPQSFYDATATAAAYLCAGRSDLTDEAQLRAGYLSYNRSHTYVEVVLAAARRYQAALALEP